MSADELRGVSPHNPASDVFGKARRSLKVVPVKPYTPRKTPFSITFIAYTGNVLCAIGVGLIALSAAIFFQGEAFKAAGSAATGFGMIWFGAFNIMCCHVAKSQLRSDDMLAHKLSHGE